MIKRLLYKLLGPYRNRKFRNRNYPVRYEIDPKGGEWVLVRNLGTHKHGGWLLPSKDAISIWGSDVIRMLKMEIK